MEQIVEDAPGHASHAARVLNDFIRDCAPRRPESEPITRQRVTEARRAARHRPASRVEIKPALPRELDADVQRALTLLTRPSFRCHVDANEFIDLVDFHLTGAQLAGANLIGAQLVRADLTGARLDEANLAGAWLGGANLTGALLLRANLTGARLDEANLAGALLLRADLTGAHLDRVNLTGAVLHSANLRSAQGLTVTQVMRADLTTTTQLPPAIAADPRVIARIKESEELDRPQLGLAAQQKAPPGTWPDRAG
ncbi:pentapeptide repeat-containing protein [Streptomyces olivoreticuli]|uniref:pentapeptide repeat-containing protein n=1 Tax=Streptomyces olivoreticuli TaxID=68246 RepID=UPI003CC7C8A4